jgi:hypothetical protein
LPQQQIVQDLVIRPILDTSAFRLAHERFARAQIKTQKALSARLAESAAIVGNAIRTQRIQLRDAQGRFIGRFKEVQTELVPGAVALQRRLLRLAQSGNVSGASLRGLVSQLETFQDRLRASAPMLERYGISHEALGRILDKKTRTIRGLERAQALLNERYRRATRLLSRMERSFGRFGRAASAWAPIFLRRTEQASRALEHISGVGQGMLAGLALLQGNVMGLGFSLLFLRFAEIPVVAATVSLMLAVAGLARTIKTVLVTAPRLADQLDDLRIRFQALTGDARAAGNLLFAAGRYALRFGADVAETARAMTSLGRVMEISQASMRLTAGIAAGLGISMSQAGEKVRQLLEQYARATTARERLNVLDRASREFAVDLRGVGSASEIASRLLERYGGLAEEKASTLSGTLQQLRTAGTLAFGTLGRAARLTIMPLVRLMVEFAKALGSGVEEALAGAYASGRLAREQTGLQRAVQRLLPYAIWLGRVLGSFLVSALRVSTRMLKGVLNVFAPVMQGIKQFVDFLRREKADTENALGPWIKLFAGIGRRLWESVQYWAGIIKDNLPAALLGAAAGAALAGFPGALAGVLLGGFGSEFFRRMGQALRSGDWQPVWDLLAEGLVGRGLPLLAPTLALALSRGKWSSRVFKAGLAGLAAAILLALVEAIEEEGMRPATAAAMGGGILTIIGSGLVRATGRLRFLGWAGIGTGAVTMLLSAISEARRGKEIDLAEILLDLIEAALPIAGALVGALFGGVGSVGGFFAGTVAAALVHSLRQGLRDRTEEGAGAIREAAYNYLDRANQALQAGTFSIDVPAGKLGYHVQTKLGRYLNQALQDNRFSDEESEIVKDTLRGIMLQARGKFPNDSAAQLTDRVMEALQEEWGVSFAGEDKRALMRSTIMELWPEIFNHPAVQEANRRSTKGAAADLARAYSGAMPGAMAGRQDAFSSAITGFFSTLFGSRSFRSNIGVAAGFGAAAVSSGLLTNTRPALDADEPGFQGSLTSFFNTLFSSKGFWAAMGMASGSAAAALSDSLLSNTRQKMKDKEPEWHGFWEDWWKRMSDWLGNLFQTHPAPSPEVPTPGQPGPQPGPAPAPVQPAMPPPPSVDDVNDLLFLKGYYLVPESNYGKIPGAWRDWQQAYYGAHGGRYGSLSEFVEHLARIWSLMPTPFARGGIVRKPTLAFLGEQGPEAVVPLRPGQGAAGLGVAGPGTININIDLSGAVISHAQTVQQLAGMVAERVVQELRLRRPNIVLSGVL